MQVESYVKFKADMSHIITSCVGFEADIIIESADIIIHEREGMDTGEVVFPFTITSSKEALFDIEQIAYCPGSEVSCPVSGDGSLGPCWHNATIEGETQSLLGTPDGVEHTLSWKSKTDINNFKGFVQFYLSIFRRNN